MTTDTDAVCQSDEYVLEHFRYLKEQCSRTAKELLQAYPNPLFGRDSVQFDEAEAASFALRVFLWDHPELESELKEE